MLKCKWNINEQSDGYYYLLFDDVLVFISRSLTARNSWWSEIENGIVSPAQMRWMVSKYWRDPNFGAFIQPSLNKEVVTTTFAPRNGRRSEGQLRNHRRPAVISLRGPWYQLGLQWHRRSVRPRCPWLRRGGWPVASNQVRQEYWDII